MSSIFVAYLRVYKYMYRLYQFFLNYCNNWLQFAKKFVTTSHFVSNISLTLRAEQRVSDMLETK